MGLHGQAPHAGLCKRNLPQATLAHLPCDAARAATTGVARECRTLSLQSSSMCASPTPPRPAPYHRPPSVRAAMQGPPANPLPLLPSVPHQHFAPAIVHTWSLCLAPTRSLLLPCCISAAGASQALLLLPHSPSITAPLRFLFPTCIQAMLRARCLPLLQPPPFPCNPCKCPFTLCINATCSPNPLGTTLVPAVPLRQTLPDGERTIAVPRIFLLLLLLL